MENALKQSLHKTGSAKNSIKKEGWWIVLKQTKHRAGSNNLTYRCSLTSLLMHFLI